MTAAYLADDFLGRFWGKNLDISELPLKLIIYLIVSLVFGAIVWRESEPGYQRYLKEYPEVEIEPPISLPEA